jgi:hypothetical protein
MCQMTAIGQTETHKTIMWLYESGESSKAIDV